MNPRPSSLVRLALTMALLVPAQAGAGIGAQAPAATKDLGQRLIGTDVRSKLPTRLFGVASQAEHKLVLYRWWTDACPYCERSLPALEELRTKYEAQGLRTVAVYHPKPARAVSDETIRAQAEKLGYHGPLAADLDWVHLRRLWLSTGTREATSASFLVDHVGFVIFVHPGPEFHPSVELGHEACSAGYQALDAAIRAGLEPPITLGGLLDEMLDRGAWTRTRTREFPIEDELRSWDTRTVQSGLLPSESVVVHGPGALVRIQSTVPSTEIEVRVDGANEPVLRGRMDALASGANEIPAPLAETHAGSHTLRLPIPFRYQVDVRRRIGARGAPLEAEFGLAPEIEVRRYPVGTRVEALTPAVLVASRALIAEAAAALAAPSPALHGETQDFSFTLSKSVPEGLLFTDKGAVPGPRAVSEIHLRVEADDLPRALRRLVLRMSFDGEPCVSAPLADFFATDERMAPFESWPVSVDGQGDFRCRWIMPYRERFDLAIDNLATPDVHVAGLVRTVPWEFDERTLYFHARWHHAASLFEAEAGSKRFAADGPGVLVGESWSLMNTANAYWGTGDAGHTTDDDNSGTSQSISSYFGFHESNPATYASPHEARTRLDSPDHHGFTSLARFRTLDALPFRSLRLWFQLPLTPASLVDATITQFFYAQPGTGAASTRIAAQELDALPRETPPWRRVGVLEGEDLVVTQRERFEIDTATIPSTSLVASWSNGKGLRALMGGKGAFLEFEATLPISAALQGKPRAALTLQMSRGPDHARLRFFVNGVALKRTFDGRSKQDEPPKPFIAGEVALGQKILIRVESLGGTSASDETAQVLGLDFLELAPAADEGK